MFTPSDWRDIGNRKFQFVARAQFLCYFTDVHKENGGKESNIVKLRLKKT